MDRSVMLTRPDTTGEPDWLRTRREEAWALFEAGPPGRKHPRWLFTDPSGFLQGEPATIGVGAADADIVLVDGRLASHTAPPGVRVLPLASDDEVARVHLNAAADDDHAAALNMAMWQDGVLIDIEPDQHASLRIVHIHTGPGLRFDRVLVHAQDNSSLRLLQEFRGTGTVSAVTELQAHAGARIHRDLWQDMDPDAKCLHTTFLRTDKDATIEDVHLDYGGAQSRNTTIGTLAAPGGHIDLSGLYITSGSQRSDHWTRIDHAVPDCTSAQLYKGVLAGSSRGSFTGNVLVRKDAQRSSAEQENRNLLLSDKALAESTPQLEIFADDVQCSHGSTVGQLDDKALFFLRARGIPAELARQMLTKAFAAEVVEKVEPGLRERVTERLDSWFGAMP